MRFTTVSFVPRMPLPARVLQGTMLVALLQPSPETFELFDDVMLLASGMVSGLRAQKWAGSAA